MSPEKSEKNQPITKPYYQYLITHIVKYVLNANELNINQDLLMTHKMIESQKSLQRFKDQEKL